MVSLLATAVWTFTVQAQTTCYTPNGGCTPPEQPSQCFPGPNGPAMWTDPGGNHTAQWRRALMSPETTSHGPLPSNGQPPYCGGQYEVDCNGANPTVRIYTRGSRILIDYDAPNYYCQQPGDWPPGFTCTNDPLAISDNLILEDSGGNIWSVGFIYYEYGTWDTGIDIPCGSTSTWSARIEYVCLGGGPYPFKIATDSAPLTGDCKDRNPCPTCPPGGPNTQAGNPVHLGSGDVSYTEQLFSIGQSPAPLSFSMTYHSSEALFPNLVSSPVGLGWNHTFSQTLRPTDTSGATLYRITPEGYEEQYQQTSPGVWQASSPGVLRGTVTLDSSTSQYVLTDLDGTATAFDVATGDWLSTTDRWGNSVVGGYDGNGNLATVTDSMGRQIALSYTNGQLTQITLPDGQAWKLAYSGSELAAIFDPLHSGITPWRAYTYQPDGQGIPRLLTEVQDDSGVELEGHSYDAQDRGTTSVSEGGRSQVTVAYDTPSHGQNTVTHSIDGSTTQQSVFTMHYTKGQFLPDQIVGDCATCGGGSDSYSFHFDASNHVSSMTDANGHTTAFAYDANGNITSRTEASGTSLARTATYSYDYAPWPSFQTEISEPSAAKPGAQKVTTLTWNSSGTPETTLTRQESGYLTAGDTQPTTYTTTSTFDSRHRLLTTIGPRTDVNQTTTRTYYADGDSTADRRGRLEQVTDPAGLSTTYDNYDVFGTARKLTDANGVVTQLQTDGKGRVVTSTSKAVSGDPNESSDYVTTYTFDGRDRLSKTTLPRSNALSYGYEDGTNRIIDTIRLDSSGKQYERRHLTLNVIGDKLAEEDQACGTPSTACASWTTDRQEGYVYDSHNRLVQVNHPVPAGANIENTYDNDGLLVGVKDENHSSPNTLYSYDALHRLTTVAQFLTGAPGNSITTRYAYDDMDNLASVTDPNGNITRYSYDDFRRLQSQTSPVTGTTIYQYDPAGNLVSTTDARAAVTAKTFDADNRILTSSSTLTSSTETVQYAYDVSSTGNYGKGRLSQMTDPSGSTSYTYERRGILKGESRSILGSAYTTGYHYDANGNRDQITYPSGHSVAYAFDFADRPVSARSSSTIFVSSASYLPFGPQTSLSFGNGTVKTTTYDARFRPVENKLAGSSGTIADYVYGEDALGNITQIHDEGDVTFNRDFAYDDLNRLTAASTGYSLWGNGSYSYDPMGNMTSLALGSARTATFSYSGTLPKLASVTENGNTRAVSYDAAGNEIAVGGASYAYSPRNFLASGDGLSYTYDGRGLRVATTVAAQFGTISGTVVSASGNAPIPGAEVRVTGSPSATSTDASGNFNLTQAAGTYTLTISAPGFLSATTPPFTLAPGGTFSAGTIALQVAPGTITGTVVSSDGGGSVPGATVTVLPINQTATTDASGNFSVSEPPGTYSLTIGKTGYTTLTIPSFTLAAGAIHSVGTVTLAANNATVTGNVINSTTNAALPGVTVTATVVPGGPIPTAVSHPELLAQSGGGPGGPYTTTTDSSGNFTLSIPAGTYSVSFTKTGFTTQTNTSVTLAPGAAFSMGTVALAPTGVVTGTILNGSNGSPLSGASVAVTGTLNETTTDSSGNFTLSQGAGTYSLTISANGFETLVTNSFTLVAGQTYVIGTLRLNPVALSVYVGYADNLRPSSAFPVPWQGDPNVVFIGGGPVYDAGAIRLDNNTATPMNVDGVTVNLGRPGPVFNLWGSFTIPSNSTVILTQSKSFDFDTSDFPIVACGGTLQPGDPRVPRVTISVGGVSTDYFDTGHILDTGGYDLVCKGNESLQWRLIGTVGIGANGGFLLTPIQGTAAIGEPYTLTATLTDANNQPLPNVTVHFTAAGGPDQGLTGSAVTDIAGVANFSYTGKAAGSDTWVATSTNQSGGSITSNPAIVTWPSLAGIDISVGYADDARANPAFPIPWQGAPNVVFIGNGPTYDAGAIRLDNSTNTPLTVDSVSVNLQRPGPVFNLWGSFTIPANGSAILTQTAEYNFDTSDYPIVGCKQPIPPGDQRIPKVTVTIGGFSSSYLDACHILDTFGYDSVCLGNESLQWRAIGACSGPQFSPGTLTLFPPATTEPLGAAYTATAVALDPSGQPLPNVAVAFAVKLGPNAGKTGQAVTDASGVATFTYTSSAIGTDTILATMTNATKTTIPSNTVTVAWIPSVNLILAPPSASNPLGAPYTATLTVTDSQNHPVPSLSINFQIVFGPNIGKTGQAVTNANGQAVFVYTSIIPGTDTLEASVTTMGGASIVSNTVTAAWSSNLVINLSPPTATVTVGTPYTATAAVSNGAGQPAANVPVTFQVVSGPNAGTTGTATTNASGVATFSYTSAAIGTDTLVATATQGGNSVTSNQVTVTWIAIPTTLTYTGPTSGDYNDPLTLTAQLTVTSSGAPVPNETVIFTLGSQTASGTTDSNGVASVTITPNGVPGPTPLTAAFSGSGPYLPSTASATVTIARDDTAIFYTGPAAVADGQPQTVSALLEDAADQTPIPNETVSFTVGLVTATATTDVNGIATATITIPATQTTGSTQIIVSFVGDTYEMPAQTTAPVLIYLPESFVVWGGNTPGLTIGQSVNFWGAQWWKQVIGGDYHANADFKGWASPVAPIGLCEATRTTTSTPPLDASCWTASPGNSGNPPATIPSYIGVIVSTSINELQGMIYGNTSALVVVQVNPVPPYQPDPGHPAYGTIVAVIADGDGLLPNLTYTGPSTLTAGAGNPVSAILVDPMTRSPLEGETVTFTLGTSTASATTDPTGTANATLMLPATQPIGPAQLQVSFAGSGSEPPISITVPVMVVSQHAAMIRGGDWAKETITGTANRPTVRASWGQSDSKSVETLVRLDLKTPRILAAAVFEVAEEGGGGGESASEPTGQHFLQRTGRARPEDVLSLTQGSERFSFYTPEMSLMAETQIAVSGSPAIAYEYVWFNGHPVAEIDDTASVTTWTFTDHLGTPILQTSSSQGVSWRAEYEPYGTVYGLRSLDAHQPLRLPGQEAEQLNLGANGLTERSYNIFRWYRGDWARYTSGDPTGLRFDTNTYRYAGDNPLILVDDTGLARCHYSIKDHTMRCRPNGGGPLYTVGPNGVFSGLGPCTNNPDCKNVPYSGPIKPGQYRMNRDLRPKHQHPQWWRLEPDPPIAGWKVITHWGGARGGFAWHQGTRSEGCITADKNNPRAVGQFDAVNNLLLSEDGANFLYVTP